MKWYRLLATLAVLATAACANPTAPRFPQEEDPKQDDRPPPKTGLVLEQGEVRLA